MRAAVYEHRAGWIGSIVFHILLGLFLFFSTVTNYRIEPQFVEMTWGEITSTEAPITEIPATENASQLSGKVEQQNNNSLSMPTRRYIDMPDEVISMNSSKKSINTEAPAITSSGKTAATEDQKRYTSLGYGSRDNTVGKSTSFSDATVSTPFGAGAEDGALGNNTAFVLQWAGGGNRKLIGGDMPTYPSGVNQEVQIKLRVVVLPNGTVRSVSPAQKGETRLENAAIAKVRFWKFEPLLTAQPQVEQVCTITFNFTLQ